MTKWIDLDGHDGDGDGEENYGLPYYLFRNAKHMPTYKDNIEQETRLIKRPKV